MPPSPSFPLGVILAILWPGTRRTLLKSKTKESSSCLKPTGAPRSRIRQCDALSSVPTAAPVITEGRPLAGHVSTQPTVRPCGAGQQCSGPCWASRPLTARRQCRCLPGRCRGAASWTRVPRGCRGWSPGCRHTATRGTRSLRWGRHGWPRAWAAHGCRYPPHLQGLRQCQQGGPFPQWVLECPLEGHLTLVSRFQGTVKDVCVWGDAGHIKSSCCIP